MTNTKMLRDLIVNSGMKMGFIAARVGISRAALNRKINNRTAFNQFQIERLCKVLAIDSLETKEAVFFAKDVDKNDDKTDGASEVEARRR